MDRQPVLVVTGGPLSGQFFPITAEGLMLGRDPDCDIAMPEDPNVSREHARVFLHNSAVWAQDAGSRNGVVVNGKRLVRPKQVGPGDKLTVGDHAFTVELRRPDGDDEVSNITVAPVVPAAADPPAVPAEPSGTGARMTGGIIALIAIVIGAAAYFLGAS
ncbi:MAG: FHA domain-containing protein [Myxococcota bacterium]|nr:FHA domain-containing protein [Myxococcota bacterium]MEC8422237.1 FHA domain-containing protein [Myxococcota bacterium]